MYIYNFCITTFQRTPSSLPESPSRESTSGRVSSSGFTSTCRDPFLRGYVSFQWCNVGCTSIIIYSDSSHGHPENTSFAPFCCWLRRWRECLGCPVLDSCCYWDSRKVMNWNEKVAACRSMRTSKSSPFLGGEKKNHPQFWQDAHGAFKNPCSHSNSPKGGKGLWSSILTWWQYISEVPRVIWMVTRIKQNKPKEPIALCKPSCGLQIS